MLLTTWKLVLPFQQSMPGRAVGVAGNNALIYIRVSTPDQVRNLSLSTQEKACREYCASNGLEVEGVFREEGQSAKTADRDQLQELLVYCKKHRTVGFVVVHSVSRFSRDTSDHLFLRAYLARFGIKLRSVSESAIDETPTGRLVETMASGFSQWENEIKAGRTKVGMRAAVEEGGWTCRPPLGYLKKGRGHESSTIQPDPERAGLITRAFQLYRKGSVTKQEVLRKLTAMGLVTRSGKPLSSRALDSILRNEFYAGWLVVPKWNYRERGSHKPLVREEVFEQVQALLSGRRKPLVAYVKNNPDFPLRGFVRCGSCGKGFTGSWSTGRAARYAYYRCSNATCRQYVPKDVLEKSFLAHLHQLTPRPEYLKLLHAVLLDVWRKKTAEARTLQLRLRGRLDKLRAKKMKLDDAYLYENRIDGETYEEQRQRLAMDILGASNELSNATMDELDGEALIEFATHVLGNAGRMWKSLSMDKRQRLQGFLFPKGLPFSDGKFGTAAISTVFNGLESLRRRKAGLVAHTGLTWNQLAQFLRDLELLRAA
jgi:site-specific DNA recombinase